MFNLQGKYTNALIMTEDIEDEAVEQVRAMCDRYEFQNANIVIMPDVHAGKGCTVGTTIYIHDKRIDPQLVGVDIGCGVYTVIFEKEDLNVEELERIIQEFVPSGQNIRLFPSEKISLSFKEKVENIAEKIHHSERALYYLNSLGTLGAGNHFIELGESNGKYYLSIHTGSRKLGLDVCDYFTPGIEDRKEELKIACDSLILKYKEQHREKEISNALIELKNNFYYQPKSYIEGNRFDGYIDAMKFCQEYAILNRKIIAHEILSHLGIECYDSFQTMHNYIEFLNNGDMIVRKGAIAAYYGQRVAIPLNMRDGVIIGYGKGNSQWNYSAPHGAGRSMSRSKARRELKLSEYQDAMKGVQTWSVSEETIDEAPMAYKPAEEIVSLIQDTVDVSFIVKPIYNFKAQN